MTLHANPDLLTPAASAHKAGSIVLVGAGPGARDLLTLRALDRLREADVIYYDRLVDPEVLSLAHPRAQRVYVGKEVGAHAWTQGQICAAIVASALQGLRVVRLKSGDPSLFGRAAEEIAAAGAAGIEVEIVPGITAASAAAASLVAPLTERGRVDRVVLATGTNMSGAAVADLSASLTPGTRLVLYMAMQHLDRIEVQLLAAGAPADAEVSIVMQVSTEAERRVECLLLGMAEAARSAKLANPAVVMICVPERASGQTTSTEVMALTGVGRQRAAAGV